MELGRVAPEKGVVSQPHLYPFPAEFAPMFPNGPNFPPFSPISPNFPQELSPVPPRRRPLVPGLPTQTMFFERFKPKICQLFHSKSKKFPGLTHFPHFSRIALFRDSAPVICRK